MSDERRFSNIGERLRVARRRAFVGRSAELRLFRSALEDRAESFAVLFITGPGGVGKSALLRRFADEAADAGYAVVEVDGLTGAPTPEEFEAATAKALTEDRTVLLVDTFEEYQSLEGWLRDRFLPRLPSDALVVFAGRARPGAVWWSDPGWHDVVRVITLDDLPRDDAVALLSARGVPPELHPALISFAGGHPLALSLAAAVVKDSPGGSEGWTPTQDVIGTLLSRLVGQVPSTVHRRALEICAHVNTTTESLLRAILPEADAGALFAWLRQLPFMESGPRGIHPHDVVREVLDTDLQWRDSQWYEDMHGRLLRHFVEQVRTASEPDRLATTTALMYLLRHGFGLFGEGGEHDVYEDVLRPDDRQAILELAAEFVNEASVAIADFWLRQRPEAFSTYRSSESGELVGFLTFLRLAEPCEEENAADPAVAEAWAHVRKTSPLRDGEHLAVSRFLVTRDGTPSPAGDLIAARILTEVIRSGQIAWSCTVLMDPETWRRFPNFANRRPPIIQIGDRPFGLFFENWQEMRFETWLGQLVRRGTAPESTTPEPPVREFEVLSRFEFDAAVRGALRSFNRPDALSANPLIRTRAVAEVGSPPSVAALRELLSDVVERLGDDPRDAKLYRAVRMTFLQGIPTQQAAAERLGLPFSTYYRHLSRGVARVCDLLWQRELAGMRFPEEM
jgi:hypothetical protein